MQWDLGRKRIASYVNGFKISGIFVVVFVVVIVVVLHLHANDMSAEFF